MYNTSKNEPDVINLSLSAVCDEVLVSGGKRTEKSTEANSSDSSLWNDYCAYKQNSKFHETINKVTKSQCIAALTIDSKGIKASRQNWTLEMASETELKEGNTEDKA